MVGPRELSVETQFKLQQDWDVGDFDSLYTFYYLDKSTMLGLQTYKNKLNYHR